MGPKMYFAFVLAVLATAHLADGACVLDPQVPKDFQVRLTPNS